MRQWELFLTYPGLNITLISWRGAIDLGVRSWSVVEEALRRSNAPDQVFLFVSTFGANGEGVEHPER